MDFTVIDGYLLADACSKERAVASLLKERTTAPGAGPFYRALEAVGTQAADEALVAIRLILAGHPVTDERVRRVRALSAVARAAAKGDRTKLAAIRRRDGAAVQDLVWDGDTATLASSAREAYAAELQESVR